MRYGLYSKEFEKKTQNKNSHVIVNVGNSPFEDSLHEDIIVLGIQRRKQPFHIFYSH